MKKIEAIDQIMFLCQKEFYFKTNFIERVPKAINKALFLFYIEKKLLKKKMVMNNGKSGQGKICK